MLGKINDAFFTPKEGYSRYIDRLKKTILAKQKNILFLQKSIPFSGNYSPISFIPTIFGLASPLSICREHNSSSRTTDLLMLTSARENFSSLISKSLDIPHILLSIESLEQKSPTQIIQFLTSNPIISDNPPIYPECVASLFSAYDECRSIYYSSVRKIDPPDRIISLLDIGVGNGEFLLSSCIYPNIIYDGIDLSIPDDYRPLPITDSIIRPDSRGIIDSFSRIEPDIVKRIRLSNFNDKYFSPGLSSPSISKETSPEKDIIAIHSSLVSPDIIQKLLPFLSKLGILIIYGTPYSQDNIDIIIDIASSNNYDFWGIGGLQNVQNLSSPFIILSKTPASFLNLFMNYFSCRFSPLDSIYDSPFLSYSGEIKHHILNYEMMVHHKRNIPVLKGNPFASFLNFPPETIPIYLIYKEKEPLKYLGTHNLSIIISYGHSPHEQSNTRMFANLLDGVFKSNIYKFSTSTKQKALSIVDDLKSFALKNKRIPIIFNTDDDENILQTQLINGIAESYTKIIISKDNLRPSPPKSIIIQHLDHISTLSVAKAFPGVPIILVLPTRKSGSSINPDTITKLNKINPGGISYADSISSALLSSDEKTSPPVGLIVRFSPDINSTNLFVSDLDTIKEDIDKAGYYYEFDEFKPDILNKKCLIKTEGSDTENQITPPDSIYDEFAELDNIVRKFSGTSPNITKQKSPSPITNQPPIPNIEQQSNRQNNIFGDAAAI
jgi:hypothetical protein